MKSDEALKQIEYLKEITKKTRFVAAYGYMYYFLWGILMIIGYFTALYINPIVVWVIIHITGFTITFAIMLKDSRNNRTSALLKRIGWQSLIVFIAGIIVYTVLYKYKDYPILIAFWPFQVGVIYLSASIHIGKDLTYIGLWLVATSIVSVFMPIPFQNIWLGITCGGGLILTGVIFRNQIKKLGDKID